MSRIQGRGNFRANFGNSEGSKHLDSEGGGKWEESSDQLTEGGELRRVSNERGEESSE